MNKSVINAMLGLLITTSFALSLPLPAHAVISEVNPIADSVTGTTFPTEPALEEAMSQVEEPHLVADLVEVCDYYYDYYGNIYYYCDYYVY